MSSLESDWRASMLVKASSNVVPGLAVSVALFPFEAMKKFLQASQRVQQPCTPLHRPQLSRGMCIFASNIVPTTFVQLTVFERIKEAYPTMPPVVNALLSGATGALTATVVENVVVRQQALRCGPVAALKDMVHARGWLGPMQSYSLIAARDCVFAVFLFVFSKSGQQTSFWDQAVANVPLAVAGAGVSHPFDTVATLKQATHEKMPAAEIAKHLWRIGGIRPFYAGFGYRVLLFHGFLTIIPEAQRRYVELLKRSTSAGPSTPA